MFDAQSLIDTARRFPGTRIEPGLTESELLDIERAARF
jgi:hypothetical protein